MGSISSFSFQVIGFLYDETSNYSDFCLGPTRCDVEIAVCLYVVWAHFQPWESLNVNSRRNSVKKKFQFYENCIELRIPKYNFHSVFCSVLEFSMFFASSAFTVYYIRRHTFALFLRFYSIQGITHSYSNIQ